MLWQLSGQEEGSGPGRGVGRLPFASGSRVVLVLGGTQTTEPAVFLLISIQ